MTAINCAWRRRYSTARQKKLTMRKRTLFTGLTRVTMITAEAVANADTRKKSAVSKFMKNRHKIRIRLSNSE
jgi:FMN-dependent NADH-azoreductase